MRIRCTKPEFWRSERIASVEWEDRFVLKGLESYVDDNGVGVDDIALIVSEVFPRDMLANPRETVARLSEAVTHLHQAGLVWRYEADGKRLLYVSFWESVQRIDKAGKGRYRRPDGTLNYGASEIRESVAKCRESVAPGTGEQGNRGTGETSSLTLVEGGPGGDPKLPVAAKAAPAARGTRLPTNWRPDDETIQEMGRRFPNVALKLEHEKFTNYWRAQPGAKGRKSDWPSTWRNWIIRASEQAPRPNGHSPPNGIGKPSLKAMGNQILTDQIIAEMGHE